MNYHLLQTQQTTLTDAIRLSSAQVENLPSSSEDYKEYQRDLRLMVSVLMGHAYLETAIEKATAWWLKAENPIAWELVTLFRDILAAEKGILS